VHRDHAGRAVPVQFQQGGAGVFCGWLLVHDAADVAQVLPVQHAGDFRDTGTVPDPAAGAVALSQMRS
jgi:hypothetical protein